MKRTLSIILTAVILMISVLPLNAFADEAPILTIELIEKLKTSDEISVTFKSGQVNLFGSQPTDSFDTVAMKGDKLAYQFTAGPLEARAVMSNGNIYGFFTAIPFLYVKLDNSFLGDVDVDKALEEITSLTTSVLDFQGSRSENLNGVIYYVEEFNDRATVTSKFYYDENNNLRVLKVSDSSNGSVYYTYFENISFEVPDSFFEVSSFALDVTPILKWLFVMLAA